MNTVLWECPIDFSKAADAAGSKNEEVIRAYLEQFGDNVADNARIEYSKIDTLEDSQLLEAIIWSVLRHTAFLRKTDILPSLYSAHQCIDTFELKKLLIFERLAGQFSMHIQELTLTDVFDFFQSKGTKVPFLFGFMFFASLYQESCVDHKEFYLDDEHQILLKALEGNLGIYLLFQTVKRVHDPKSLLQVLKDELSRDDVNEWGMVQALLTPGDKTIEPYGSSLGILDAYRNFLLAMENGDIPSDEDVRYVVELLHFAKESVTSCFREYVSMQNDFRRIIMVVVFYQRLKEFDCLHASAIRKLIEAKHLPGMPATPFPTIKSFCDYFTPDERKWLARWDMTLCSFELQYYFSEYSHSELRMRLIDLLCSVGDEDICFSEFNLLEKPEYDDDGGALNDIKGHLNVADYIKEELYQKVPTQQVRAAYRVVHRWLSAYEQETLTEEWENSPDPAWVDPYRLRYFYDEIIDDIVRHPKYNDIEIVKKLTESIYSKLSEYGVPLSLTLKFFKAYFSDDYEEQVHLYQEVIQGDSGYRHSAAYNLALAHIKCGKHELAQEVISNMNEGDSQTSLQKRLNEQVAKADRIQKIMKAPQSEQHLSDVSDLHLLYLTAAVHMAHAKNDYVIRHSPEPFRMLLVPNYRTSHTIIKELMNAQVLRVKNENIEDFEPETADEYSFTSLPLIPNIKDYFNISLFLDVLRDEIKKRTIDSGVIAACENKLKVAWVLNNFYYRLEKLLEPDEVILSLGDYEELTLLVDRFTPRQLCSIGFSAVNFVFGNMTTYGFGLQTASERLVPRLMKNLKEFSHTDFKSATFGRPKIQTFHLEQVLLWVDGVSPEIRFN